jgi:hypothetical protein
MPKQRHRLPGNLFERMHDAFVEAAGNDTPGLVGALLGFLPPEIAAEVRLGGGARVNMWFEHRNSLAFAYASLDGRTYRVGCLDRADTEGFRRLVAAAFECHIQLRVPRQEARALWRGTRRP